MAFFHASSPSFVFESPLRSDGSPARTVFTSIGELGVKTSAPVGDKSFLMPRIITLWRA